MPCGWQPCPVVVQICYPAVLFIVADISQDAVSVRESGAVEPSDFIGQHFRQDCSVHPLWQVVEEVWQRDFSGDEDIPWRDSLASADCEQRDRAEESLAYKSLGRIPCFDCA